MGACVSQNVCESNVDKSGFDLKHHGPSKQKGISSAHYGVKFGNCIMPAPRKDHDRCSHQRFDLSELSGAENALFYGFGLFDGHGLSSAVADVAAERMLKVVQSRCEMMTNPRVRSNSLAIEQRGPSLEREGLEQAAAALGRKGGQEFKLQVSQMLTEAFSNVNAQINRDFNGQRVGSTATLVLLSSVGGNKSGTDWNVACGWVGDSRAVVVEPDGRTVRELTEDHRIDLPRENERVVAAQVAEAELHPAGKRRTVLANRVSPSTGRTGPLCLCNEITGVSTMVTRSLGDSTAATALIADPDFAFETVPDGSRLVIASDGVWDVLSTERVASLIRRTKDTRKAALLLCSMAKRTRLYGGHSSDDISAVVVNLNKSKMPPSPLPPLPPTSEAKESR